MKRSTAAPAPSGPARRTSLNRQRVPSDRGAGLATDLAPPRPTRSTAPHRPSKRAAKEARCERDTGRHRRDWRARLSRARIQKPEHAPGVSDVGSVPKAPCVSLGSVRVAVPDRWPTPDRRACCSTMMTSAAAANDGLAGGVTPIGDARAGASHDSPPAGPVTEHGHADATSQHRALQRFMSTHARSAALALAMRTASEVPRDLRCLTHAGKWRRPGACRQHDHAVGLETCHASRCF